VSCCPGLGKCRSCWSETIVRTPLPGMGGTFCLPISVENPAIATAPDVPDLTLTPHALSRENLATRAHRTTFLTGILERWERWYSSNQTQQHRGLRGGWALHPATLPPGTSEQTFMRASDLAYR
jgi:hypothetical protein